MPVANTSSFGRRTISSPSRSTTTSHSPASSSHRADLAAVSVQYGISMTRTYISSQSPILSFGAKTGQFAGNGR